MTPGQHQKFFPDVPLDELVRPREIHLLISHRRPANASKDQSCRGPHSVGRTTREDGRRSTSSKNSKKPHWHTQYPWLQDPASLPNNKRTVEATFHRTEKQLAKEPEWKAAYTAQVHDMVNRGAAIKLSKDSVWNQLDWTSMVCESPYRSKPTFRQNPCKTCVEQQPKIQRCEPE